MSKCFGYLGHALINPSCRAAQSLYRCTTSSAHGSMTLPVVPDNSGSLGQGVAKSAGGSTAFGNGGVED
ncbi:hypothetical protein EIKCOROL_00570 [Eikenella corrodens ATCC 23834]|uniref:Uncharacterized protein n=1 Tax=Eikenella corrodens ATCC 23834 TaxID=546274 RepID=C0DT92_EIKCO|nr:hypothetical protein EIKCOROL_00570 [Eikenella corrodens ATCC 23834]